MELAKRSTDRRRYTGLVVAIPCWALVLASGSAVIYGQGRGTPWAMHVIDDSLSGPDGVRMDDVNGDGLLDITTAFEEGNAVRVFVHPGFGPVRNAWPAITVGNAPGVEDAFFVDLDGDGPKDVVSSGQGSSQIFVHWAPSDSADYLDPSAWQTASIPASVGHGWLFGTAMQVDGKNGVDIIGGGVDTAPVIAWFECPAGDRRNLAAWSMHLMSDVAWTMSLIPYDVDNDSDLDVIVTDRFNSASLEGARWLENPGTGSPLQHNPWPNHFIGAQGKQPMLSVMADLDRDGLDDLIVPTMNATTGLSFFRRLDRVANNWQEFTIAKPSNTGTPKGCNVGDVDLDGNLDIVVSFANAPDPLSGMLWLSYINQPTDPVWIDHEVSGPAGEKYDIVALVDLDGDGDLDVITTEEDAPPDSRGFGVIWYENPTIGLSDGDSDGVPDIHDNCPGIPNPSQEDLDHDNLGDPCDDDIDGDGALNLEDNCPTIVNADQADADEDNVGNLCDNCPATIPDAPVDASGCPPLVTGDFDRDGDVDQKDYGHLQACLTGAGVSQTLAACENATLDADDDVDKDDMGVFQLCVSGPNTSANPACRN